VKILLAEDEPVTSRLLQRCLERWGHEALVAATGEDAWALYLEHRPRLVITDWIMPGMDGPELIGRIRAASDGAYAYALLLTAKSSKQDVVSGMDAGADDFLSKPFDEEELRARIRAGVRILELQRDLARRNEELERANEEIGAANARMRRDLEAAARIQQALLPAPLPDFAEVRFAWSLKPCVELAGDILNVFPLGPHHVAFYVLDVSGHGVPAALMSVTLSRVLVAAHGQPGLLTGGSEEGGGQRITPPAVVARRLNRRFSVNPSMGQFFTLLYGVVDRRTRHLRYVSAGHPGPVLLSAGRRSTLLEATGPPVGILDGVKYEDRVLELEPGDRLFAYSDGITEARNVQGEFFGTERLVRQLEETRSLPLEEAVPRLLESVERFRGRPGLADDASCVALELAPA
jgi:sigma-B regulation protein RsbU (phosphoserine phosphatase)